MVVHSIMKRRESKMTAVLCEEPIRPHKVKLDQAHRGHIDQPAPNKDDEQQFANHLHLWR